MHTPGPWIVNKTKRSLIDSPTVNRIIAETRGESLEEKRSNAAFIVTACNSHDDLLEACKMLIHFIPEDWPMPLGYSDVVHQAVNAIAKAEGK